MTGSDAGGHRASGYGWPVRGHPPGLSPDHPQERDPGLPGRARGYGVGMGVSPPYLHDDTEPGVPVRVDTGRGRRRLLLTVRGSWDDQLRRTTSVSLRRCFTEHPDALIVDLSRLLDPRSESAPTWTTARTVAASCSRRCIWPCACRRICRSPTGCRAWARAPVPAGLREGATGPGGGGRRLPGAERLMADLRPDPDAPSTARNLVSDACLAWGLAQLLHPSRLVMSSWYQRGRARRHRRSGWRSPGGARACTRRSATVHRGCRACSARPPEAGTSAGRAGARSAGRARGRRAVGRGAGPDGKVARRTVRRRTGARHRLSPLR